MPPSVALFLCIFFISLLFVIEYKQKSEVSFAILVPLIWYALVASRNVSHWLSMGTVATGEVDYLQGSPIDRAFYLALILIGIFILLKRKIDFSRILKNNTSIFLLFLFMFTITNCAKKSVEIKTTAPFNPEPTVAQIDKHPPVYFDSLIITSGTLVNLGADYFKDLRLVLKDSAGNSVPVLPWVPLEIPPMHNPNIPRPKILSDYLDQHIKIKAYVRFDSSGFVFFGRRISR